MNETPRPFPGAEHTTLQNSEQITFSNRTTLVTESNYPGLKLEYPENVLLFVQEYVSKPFPLETVAQKNFLTVSLAELLQRQHLQRYPGIQTISISEDDVHHIRKTLNIKTPFTMDYVRRNFHNKKLWAYRDSREYFEEDKERSTIVGEIRKLVKSKSKLLAGQDADKRFTAASTIHDENMNLVIAARLALEPNESIYELISNYPNVNRLLLNRAFLQIINDRDIRATLKKPGMIFEDIPDAYLYESLTEQLVASSLLRLPLHIKRDTTLHWPYSLTKSLPEDNEQVLITYPDIEFLPYIFRGDRIFISELPFVLEEGDAIDISIVRKRMMTILGGEYEGTPITTIPDQIIFHYIEEDLRSRGVRPTPESNLTDMLNTCSAIFQQKVRTIFPEIQREAYELNRLYKYFLKNPGILDKSNVKHTPRSPQNQYSELRQQILDAGGRSPRTAVIRFARDTSIGDV